MILTQAELRRGYNAPELADPSPLERRLHKLIAATRRDYYGTQAIPERDPAYRLPCGTMTPTTTR